jgi:catechol 2,3-dioxygenase-like lactoylglutathione lyase family enzyme
MYRDGLGFEILGSFEGHSGYDGVMLGRPGGAYHLEFTHERGDLVGRAPTHDNLLVFYIPDREAWEHRCARMESAGFHRVPSYNPYWDDRGATFADPDGYRVVLQNARWEPGAPPPR